MLRGEADRHKGRWLALVATLVLVLFGIALAVYALHHRPVGPKQHTELPAKV
jgi:hypothetical protein